MGETVHGRIRAFLQRCGVRFTELHHAAARTSEETSRPYAQFAMTRCMVTKRRRRNGGC